MIRVLQLGLVAYGDALEVQRVLSERRKAGAISDVLLLLEHPAVITLGRNSKQQNVLASREQLAAEGIELFECNRGGDVTYHGPGQLVGYPIFDLRGFSDEHGRKKNLWPVEFVRMVEEALIAVCAELGVPAQRVPGHTGVWTVPANGGPEGKLAAIGVHISRGVTSHGFALNVTTALDAFQLIVPCGIADKPVTSLQQELLRRKRSAEAARLNLAEVAASTAKHFARVFHQEADSVSTLEELLGASPQDVPLRVPRELKQILGQKETFRA